MPMLANMQPMITTTGGTSTMCREFPMGHKAISTQSVVAAERRSWRASSAPAWRHIRP